MATVVSTDDKPRRRKKRGGDRWLSEVKGIVAMLAGGFALIALATFDPSLTPAEQDGPTGPVGVWFAWVSFQCLGYAGFFLPLLVGAWGASAFLRPIVIRGWVPIAGFAALLMSAAGLLSQATTAQGGGVGGGLVGHGIAAALHAGFGNVGTWLALIAAVPIGWIVRPVSGSITAIRSTWSALSSIRIAVSS